MKRRSGAEAAEEAPDLDTETKKLKKMKKNKGTTPATAAAAHAIAGEEEKAEAGRTRSEESEEEEDAVTLPGGGSDVCQALMDRYCRSSAPQHRHLCASAAAMRSILLDEGLPLTPPAYFAAAIVAICDADRRDHEALAALSAFLSVLLPRVPVGSVPPLKAAEAALSLVALLQDSTPESLAAPTVRSLVGSLGLLMQCVDFDDWGVVKLPLRVLLRFSVDRRPKVRRCAQVSVEKVFRTFKSSVVIRKMSKFAFSLFQTYIPLAVEFSSMREGSKSNNLEKSKHIEALHMLNVMKLIVPNFSQKIIKKLLSDLYKLFSARFSLLTRNILSLLEVLLQQLTIDVLDSEAEHMISILTSYMSSGEKNPIDTLLSASTLLRDTMSRLHATQPNVWIKHLSLVFSAVAGLLISESSIAGRAADILRELINHQTDWGIFLFSSNQTFGDLMKLPEAGVIMSICATCVNVLSACSSVPSEHILAVVSDLFLKLGEYSSFFMRQILLKLSLWVTNVDEDLHDVQHVQECLGSAVISMGPEKILSMIPILLDTEKQTCSNTWLIPILKKYTVGASIQFFVEHIAPLAKSIQEICNRVQTSSTETNLPSCGSGLWSLLPAFCHYPTDTVKHFDSLAKILIEKLKEDPSSHEHVAAAIKELVNENKSILRDNQEADEMHQTTGFMTNGSYIKPRSASDHYTQKVAHRNIKALASSSMELFKSLIDTFFGSPPEKRAYLKEAIGCLASILGSSNIQCFFSSLLVELGLIDDGAELEKSENHVQQGDTSDSGGKLAVDKIEEQRSTMMELATAFVEGADKDFIDMIFGYIRPYLLGTDGGCQCEAYQTLSRILKGNSWFVLAQVDQLMNLLLGHESPVDLSVLQCRFSCLHFLFVHLLKNSGERTNTKVLLVLNEIIRFLKDSKEEVRKSAYETLLEISCSLKNSESATSESHHQQLFEMIMGYFSGSPPRMMSGAIAALSLLIYKDAGLYLYVPNMMPSVLILLQSKAKEVIKAALGLTKVLVSCLPVTEIKKLLPDIVGGILPWSSVSRNHFRSKVRTIVEIVIRKCGIDSVLLVLPDKFKGFVRTITEQSLDKGNSRGVTHSKTGPEQAYPSLTRKHLGLSKGPHTEKHQKDRHCTGPVNRHSSKSGQRQLINRQKRKFEYGSSLGRKHGNHSKTLEDPQKQQSCKTEPRTSRKSKIKRVHGKSLRGKKGEAVRRNVS